MLKKQQEIENYLCLISMFSDYEKYTLMEYADNDYNKVVFFNPKNSELCVKLLRLVILLVIFLQVIFFVLFVLFNFKI